MEDTKILTMPVIALRGLTMLPEMTISFDISRKKSIAAVEKAMVSDQRVCLVAQKDPDIQNPAFEQLWYCFLHKAAGKNAGRDRPCHGRGPGAGGAS